jgi:hypothetical protein
MPEEVQPSDGSAVDGIAADDAMDGVVVSLGERGIVRLRVGPN